MKIQRLMAFAGALLAAMAPQSSFGMGTPTPSISGTFIMPDSPCSMVNTGLVASVGVYVLPLNSKGAEWSAPVLTDSYGRFVFYNLANGKYLLRIMCGDIRAWEQIVTVPQALGPIKVHSTIIDYSAGDSQVNQALLALPAYPTATTTDYFFLAGIRPFQGASNCLWYGKDVPLDDVKTIASALLRGNVSLRSIRQIPEAKSGGSKSIINKLVLVGSNPALLSAPALTLDAISAGRF